MRRVYIDTSAAAKLVFKEAESAALQAALDQPGRSLVSSWLLYAELHCAVNRRGAPYTAEKADDALSLISLVDLERIDLIKAASEAPLRASDAIHLAAAKRLAVDELITYDQELLAAAEAAGITPISPR